MNTERFEFITTVATGYQLELLIRQYGIPVSNRYARGNRIHFDVPQAQAKWATYIFQRAGIMPISKTAASVKVTAPGALPTAWGVGVRRGGFMAGWVDFIGTILGAPRRKAWQADRQARGKRAPRRRARR